MPFEAFLSALALLGFDVGVERRARLQRILDHLGPDSAPQRLKTLLCPIFASNDAQQDTFYRLFDQLFPELAQPADAPPPPLPPARLTVRRHTRLWLVVAANVIWLGILTFTGYRAVLNHSAVPAAQQKSAGDSSGGIAEEPVFGRGPDLAPRSAVPPKAVSVPLPTVLLRLVPYAIVLGLILYQLLAWVRRQILLARPPQRKPPSTWQDHPDRDAPRVYQRSDVAGPARRLRTREPVPSETIDIPETIRRTIRALGFVRFAFGAGSRYPEHLVLIERQSAADHLAELNFQLINGLRKEAVLLDTYFYEGDAQVCYAEGDNRRHYLDDLHTSNRDRRLIIFGDPRSFSNPYAYEPSKPSAILRDFRMSAILYPPSSDRRPIRRGGDTGWTTSLPTGLEGVRTLSLLWTGAMGAGAPPDPPPLIGLPVWDELRWREKLPEYVAALRAQLGPEKFRWLSACALHSQLHWDLTLTLGAAVLRRNPTEDEMLSLYGLPWFRSEPMPSELRQCLVSQLGWRTERRLRAVVVDFLKKHPAPRGSFAETLQKSAIAAQLLALQPSEEVRVSQSREWTRLLAEKEPGRFARRLPRWFRRAVFELGVPAFGLSGGVRPALAFASVLLVAAGLWSTGQIPPVRDWLQYRTIVFGGKRPSTTCSTHPPPYRTSTGWVKSGRAYFDDNEFTCAIEAFTNAIQMNGQEAEAFAGRAGAILRSEPNAKPAAAKKDLDAAIRLDPKLSRAYYWLGDLLERPPNADIPQALAAGQKAAALAPADPYPHNLLGVVYTDLKQYDASHREFAEAIRLDPDWPLPYVGDGVTFERENKIDQAVSRNRRALELDPNFTVAHTNLAVYLHRTGKTREAIAECSKAIELDPGARKAHLLRGSYYSELGDHQSAWADADYVVRHSPEADAYVDRGAYSVRMGNFAAAVDDFSKAMGLLPDFELAYFDRAYAYQALGDNTKAIADFEKVIQLNGPEERKKTARERINALR
jgi:tetratricopeptide (TPR) repeat protein